MIPDQVIPIHFGQGVDTKTDPKLAVAGKMLRLENAVFTSPGKIIKRNGYTQISSSIVGGGNLVSPKMVKVFKNELVCADSGQFYSYSQAQQAWAPKGGYQPTAVSKSVVSRSGFYSHVGSVSAVLGNLGLFAWSVNRVPTASVIDVSTGTQLLPEFTLCAAGANTNEQPTIQCAVVSGSQLGVFYLNTSYKLAYRPLTASGATVSFGAEVVLTTDTQSIPGVFAVTGTPTGAAIAYLENAVGKVKVITINAAGAVQNTFTGASWGGTALSINCESGTSNLWVYYFGAGTNFYYTILSQTLSTVLGATVLANIPFATYPSAPAIAAIGTSSGNQTAVLCVGDNNSQPMLFTVTAQSGGAVGSITPLVTNVALFSEPFAMNGQYYVAANNQSSDGQATLFFINISDGSVLAKVFGGESNDYRAPPTGTALSPALSKPSIYNSTQVILAAGETYLITTVNGSAYILGTSYASLDFGHVDLFQSVQADDNLVLNGGIIRSYDSQAVTELGFLLFPEVLSSSVGGSGNMADGSYGYYFTYRWTDAQGNIYESSPSPLYQVVVTGHTGTGSVTLKVTALSLTQKKSPLGNVQLVAYRTSANGTLAHETRDQSLTGANSPTLNDPTKTVLTFVDSVADSFIAGSTPLYTQGGVIENVAPPAATALTLHKNRLWIVNSESPNQLWYTKTFNPGAGVSFSDLLTVQVDAKGGACKALASMDDKLVILEERAPLAVAGDGANDAGAGSTLSDPQPIPSDAGCSGSKGVATFPMGVLFKSPKGIYLLDRALQVKYLGMEVEAYNAQNVVASTLIADKTQIRFLCDSGLTLVYDYVSNQWSTFTNHAGYSADVWQGKYVYARTDGKIYQENPGSYLDGSSAFAVLAQTAWLSFAQVQGFQRVRRFGMLGDYANGGSSGHGVQVSAAYDFGSSFSSPIPYGFGSASSSGTFQYRERLPIQKCDAISLLIQEVTTGDSVEFVSLTDLSFEAGIMRGLNKLGQTRSVG